MGAIFCAVIMVLAFVWGAHEFIRYRTGTPTTATVTQCSVGRGGHCEGTWTIGGVPQHGNVKHGYIFGAPPVGSTMEVRVNGGTAYTWGAGLPQLGFGLLLLGVFVVTLVSWLSRWRHPD